MYLDVDTAKVIKELFEGLESQAMTKARLPNSKCNKSDWRQMYSFTTKTKQCCELKIASTAPNHVQKAAE